MLQLNYEQIYRKTVRCRAWELAIAKAYDLGKIKIPIYLSFGTEHIAAILSEYYPDAQLFAQHRCHSYYLCFGYSDTKLYEKLIYELKEGKEGSASLQNQRMFGHSGLLGDQVPIGVGYADASNKMTLIVMGDAAAEEDYVLGAMGYAVSKNCPVLFVCEDNNLSILTTKDVRRTWDICKVAEGFGMQAKHSHGVRGLLNDLPYKQLTRLPYFVNVHVERYCWHAGSHVDIPANDNIFQLEEFICSTGIYYCASDRLELWKEEETNYVEEVWAPLLNT